MSLFNPIIKAYLATFDSELRIPYIEKVTERDDLTLIASIYKTPKNERFYCLAVVVKDGEYLFEDNKKFSAYYTFDDVTKRDVAQETISRINQTLIVRKRILTFIGNNKHLPSVLGATFTDTLIIYYRKQGKLRTARMEDGVITINLHGSEQVYLKELMEQFAIKVRRSGEGEPFGFIE